MAIKITKAGQKEFHGFCKWCGCEFTYEISDLKLSATSDKLECPTCGKTYYHTMRIQDPTIPGGIGPLQTIPFITTYKDSCEGCAWKEYNSQNFNYVGDTPCTWCTKKQVINTTPNGSTLQGTLNLAINPECGSDRTPCNCGLNAVCSKCSGGSDKGYTIATSSSCMCQGDVWKTITDCCANCVNELNDKQAKA